MSFIYAVIAAKLLKLAVCAADAGKALSFVVRKKELKVELS